MDKVFLIFVISVILIIFSLFIYIIISYEKKRRDKFVENTIETQGTVEGITFGFHFTYPSFFVNYYYYDKNGTKYEDNKALGIQAFRYKKGEKISVFYDLINHKNNMIIMNKGKK